MTREEPKRGDRRGAAGVLLAAGFVLAWAMFFLVAGFSRPTTLSAGFALWERIAALAGARGAAASVEVRL